MIRLVVAAAVLLAAAACGQGSRTEPVDLGPEATDGLALAQRYNCTGCHTSDGSDSIGPTWAGLAGSEVTLLDGDTVNADDEYLRRAIEDPGAEVVDGYRSTMPTQQLDADEVGSMVAYIKALDGS